MLSVKPHVRSMISRTGLCRAGRVGAALTCAVVLPACKMGVLDPQGPIGAAQKSILIDSLAIMLAIVIPTIIAIFAFAWWYRASNGNARYLPDWEYSGRIELMVWSIPALVVILLGGVAWIGSYELDPAKPIASSNEPLQVQVVSLDWKWLFIYPKQGVATVNTLTVPVGVPIQFSLTSASVMNAFFIPQLGSMIYTMNGMTNQLHLQADTIGVYPGLSSHFSGGGFADMNFKVHVVSTSDFSNWVDVTRKATEALSAENYANLSKQSAKVSPATYRLDDAKLFDMIVSQEIPPGPGPQTGQPDKSEAPQSGKSNVR
jgi:cytochrome o ubiquinol oxidase subunit II